MIKCHSERSLVILSRSPEQSEGEAKNLATCLRILHSQEILRRPDKRDSSG